MFRSSDPIGPAWVAHSGALSVRDMISPMMPRRVCKNWWGGKMVVMELEAIPIFFSPGWGWLTCDIDVVWKFEGDLIAFMEEERFQGIQWQFQKRTMTKKTQNEFLKEKQLHSRRLGFLAHSSGSWLHFRYVVNHDGPFVLQSSGSPVLLCHRCPPPRRWESGCYKPCPKRFQW